MTNYRGPRCRSCNGPCWQWKGSVWGYTCAACIAKHQNAAAARADARDRKARDRLLSKRFNNNDFGAVSKVGVGAVI
ncbi:hypothetical protein A4G26_22950 [Mycobacterium kansasii]|uniref:Uncharacterized protein n=1 Tax=Mycobacterium innocens TaxID=2341083 RepID=A0A498Q6Z9_9MYCO|nr:MULTISPECIES: hypothetical protein [Mycobacterium]KZS74738.1 hypothetical protein A4G26_22950 [Mycobacterium kansasii]VBA41998.1 hypothetical protein LAUMK13_03822 [Mycobacterium innocens]